MVQWARARPPRWWEMLLFFLAAWPWDLEADKHPSWSPGGLWCQRMIWTPKGSQHKHARLDILCKEWNDVSFIGSTGSNQLFMRYFITASVFAKRWKVEHLDITQVRSGFQKQTLHYLAASLFYSKPFSRDLVVVATTMRYNVTKDVRNSEVRILIPLPTVVSVEICECLNSPRRHFIRNFLLGAERCRRQMLYHLSFLLFQA